MPRQVNTNHTTPIQEVFLGCKAIINLTLDSERNKTTVSLFEAFQTVLDAIKITRNNANQDNPESIPAKTEVANITFKRVFTSIQSNPYLGLFLILLLIIIPASIIALAAFSLLAAAKWAGWW